jgi:hypothetical protein
MYHATDYASLRERGWLYLRKGLLFLAICLIASRLLDRLDDALDFPFMHLITESLTIVGWVALWKPIEIFLYDLPELKERKKK